MANTHVEFPERPGALSKFLELLRPEFNISLFHYRNYGGGISHPPLTSTLFDSVILTHA